LQITFSPGFSQEKGEFENRKNLTPSPSPKERGVKKQKKKNCGGSKSFFLASVIPRTQDEGTPSSCTFDRKFLLSAGCKIIGR